MSRSDAVIRIDGLAKTYAPLTGKRRLSAFLGKMPSAANGTIALSPLTVEIGRGESVGLIGSNGSGKSTLLKMLAGVTPPTSGTAEIRGRVSALLELGTGFHPEFSGRENIMHAGLLAGLSRAEVRALEPSIIAFAELEHAIDDPLKTYSSGMKMRLGFSVAHAVHPDILLVDEVLAVGDAVFRLKCYDRLREFCDGGGTFILVSHDLSSILRMCRRCLWLDRGVLRMDGPSRDVGEAYQEHVMSLEEERIRKAREGAIDEGTGTRITSFELREPGSTAKHQFRPGTPLEASIKLVCAEPLSNARLRIQARRRDHVCLLDLCSPAQDLAAGEHEIIVSFGRHRLGPAELYWSAILESNGTHVATFGAAGEKIEPLPMRIVAKPDDVLERGGLRHRVTWKCVGEDS